MKPLVILLLVALPLGLPAWGAENERAAGDALEARAFEVHYRPMPDAAELVGALLSLEGSLTLKPQLKTLVVEDRPAVLQRVETLLRSWDLPPRAVDVTLSLFLGRRDDEPTEQAAKGRGPLSTEVRGMVEALGDFTQWTSYEPLGSRSVRSVEREAVEVSIAGNYWVAFTVKSVHEGQGVVRFERFSLQERTARQESNEPLVEDLYTTSMVVAVGKLTLVVAAQEPTSKRALFLALQVEPR